MVIENDDVVFRAEYVARLSHGLFLRYTCSGRSHALGSLNRGGFVYLGWVTNEAVQFERGFSYVRVIVRGVRA